MTHRWSRRHAVGNCVVAGDSRTRRPAADRLSGPLTTLSPMAAVRSSIVSTSLRSPAQRLCPGSSSARPSGRYSAAESAPKRVCGQVRVAHEQRGAGTATVGDERLTMR